MINTTSLIDRYVAMWNETDPARRSDLIVQTFTPDATYQGPMLGGTGHDGINEAAREIQSHLPGFEFRRTGEIDAHHGFVRYTWEIISPDNLSRFAAGVDFGEVGSDGRLQSVTVFLDQAPTNVGAHPGE